MRIDSTMYVVSTTEAGELFGITSKALRWKHLTGKLRARKSSGIWLWDLGDLMQIYGKPSREIEKNQGELYQG